MRCVATFWCQECRPSWQSNQVECTVLDGGRVGEPSLQKCAICQRELSPWTRDGYTVERFDPDIEWQHTRSPHDPHRCPDCMAGSTWCRQARRLFLRLPKDYDKALQERIKYGDDLHWMPCKFGIQTKVKIDSVIENVSFWVTIYPYTFVIKKARHRLAAQKCSEQSGRLIIRRAFGPKACLIPGSSSLPFFPSKYPKGIYTPFYPPPGGPRRPNVPPQPWVEVGKAALVGEKT